MGAGVFHLGNPNGIGGLAVLEIWAGGGRGKKNFAIREGCVIFFFWNNPFSKPQEGDSTSSRQ